MAFLREALSDVGERSGQLRPYVRPVARHMPLAIMGVRMRVRHQSSRRARGTVAFTVLPELFLTTVFPITRFSASCRISRAYALSPPSCVRTSRHRFRCGRNMSFRPVALFTRHQRPCDARHLVRQCHRHQPERAALQESFRPDSCRAVPLRRPPGHRSGPHDQRLAYLLVTRLGDVAKFCLSAG